MKKKEEIHMKSSDWLWTRERREQLLSKKVDKSSGMKVAASSLRTNRPARLCSRPTLLFVYSPDLLQIATKCPTGD